MTGYPQLSCFGLLMDLLEHEVAEFTLVRHVVRTGEQGWHPLLTLTLRVVELHPQRR